MTNDGAPQRQTRNRHRSEPPLYDARFEHDACGVGFVADAAAPPTRACWPWRWRPRGPRTSRRVRGGRRVERRRRASSCRSTPSLCRLLDPAGVAGDRRACSTVPAPAAAAGRARRRPALDRGRRARCRGPGRARLARGARRARRPRPRGRRIPARDRPGAGRRGPTACPTGRVRARARLRAPPRRARSARAAGLDGVRGGLGVVADRRLQGPRSRRPPRRAVPRPRGAGRLPFARVPPALRHQHAARCGRSPSRSGSSPTTARSTPSAATARQVRGRRDDAARRSRRRIAARPPARGRSPALAGRLGLAVARRGARAAGRDRLVAETALLALVPEAPRPAPDAAPGRRRLPPAGRRVRRAVGRPAALVLQRRPPGRRAARPQRPAARGLGGHRAIASSPSRPRRAPCRSTRARSCAPAALGPGEMLLVDPAAGRVLDDAEAKSGSCAACRSTTRRVPAPTTSPSPPTGCRRAPIDGHRRDAPRPALPGRPRRRAPAARREDDGARGATSRCGAWATTRRSPGAPALDRPDGRPPPPGVRPGHQPAHRSRARARGHGPPGGARPPAAVPGRHARAAPRPSASIAPFVADLDGLLDARPRRSGTGRDGAPARRDLGPAAAASAGLGSALDRLAVERARRRRSAGAEVVVLSDAAASLDDARLPVPSVLAAGAVHAALAEAGLRGRTDIVVDAADIARRPRARDGRWPPGRRAVHPRLLLELAARAGRHPRRRGRCPRRAIGNMLPPSTPACARCSPGWASRPWPSYVGGQLFETIELAPAVVAALLPGRRGVAGAPRSSPTSPSASSAGSRRRGRSPPPPGPTGSRTRAWPATAPTASSTCTRRHATAIQALAARGRRPERRRRRGPRTYRDALARDAGRRSRDGWRVAGRGARRDPARRGRARRGDRPPVRRVGDERGRAVARGPPGADARASSALGGAANTGEGGEDPAWYAPERDGGRRDARDQAGRVGPVRRHRRVPRPRRSSSRSRSPRARSPARAASCPAARRPRTSRALRRGAAGQVAHQPAAAPRHLLDRGPRPADRRPAGDQPGGADRREARRVARRRHDRARRGQGGRRLHAPVRPRRRHGRVAAVVDQARRRAVGARASPRSTSRCCATTCATGSRCAPTAACRPAATC